MINSHQQSQYENNCSLGRYQHKGNGTDGFDRGYNSEHGVNHFEIIFINMIQMNL